eukprot:TRINITY_DN71696_c0_g1_i1.p1 TRINITY_DN71696_c0_g1~~TRINITY_DN71696_c0_g1_i1.p1  ORF type:complete len:108 (+),score=14.46 TRINITY_DN71696_c0_g1_i1:96-419(+)
MLARTLARFAAFDPQTKKAAATVGMLVSSLGVPLLTFFGYLCTNLSPMIQLPDSDKPQAGWGCYGAAALYVALFVFCYGYLRNDNVQAPSARQPVIMQELSNRREST